MAEPCDDLSLDADEPLEAGELALPEVLPDALPLADGVLELLAAGALLPDALPEVVVSDDFCSWLAAGADDDDPACDSCFFSCATAPSDSIAAATATAIALNFIEKSPFLNTDRWDYGRIASNECAVRPNVRHSPTNWRACCIDLACFPNQPEDEMTKVLIAAAVAALMAAPLAQAAGDKAKDTSADKSKAPASASQGATKDDGGAAAMFKNMDKNKDGAISRDEAKGTPHEKDFAKLDKNSDGKLSAQEHAAAPEHAGKSAATGGTNASTGTPATPKASGGSSTTNKKY